MEGVHLYPTLVSSAMGADTEQNTWEYSESLLGSIDTVEIWGPSPTKRKTSNCLWGGWTFNSQLRNPSSPPDCIAGLIPALHEHSGTHAFLLLVTDLPLTKALAGPRQAPYNGIQLMTCRRSPCLLGFCIILLGIPVFFFFNWMRYCSSYFWG